MNASVRQLADEADMTRIRRNDTALDIIARLTEYLALYGINEKAAYDVAVETVNGYLDDIIKGAAF